MVRYNTQYTKLLYTYIAEPEVKSRKRGSMKIGDGRREVGLKVVVDLGINLERYRALEPEVAAASADREGDLPVGLLPALSDDVPDGEVIARERESDSLALTGLDRDGVEALEDRRGLASGRGVVDVELGDLQEQGASTKGASQV